MGEATFSPETLAQLKAAIKTAAEQQSPEQIRENVLLAIKLRMLEQLQSGLGDEHFHPGAFLRMLLEQLGIKQKRLATYLDLHPTNLNSILAGRRNVNSPLSLKLEQVFQIPARLWLQLQLQYELQHLVAEEPQAQYSLKGLLEG